MKKAIAIGAAMVALGLVAAAPAQANSDVCTSKARGGERGVCTAATRESHVEEAFIRMGNSTRGTFTLTCENHWGDETVDRGVIGRGGKRLIEPDGWKPDCILHARGSSRSRAVVFVSLR